LFGILNFGHAQRRRSRGASACAARAPRVVICLLFGICYLGFQYVNELPTKQILSEANQRLIMNQDSLT